MGEQAQVIEVNMPRLSDSMEEGLIVAWLKSSGDAVAQGEEIVEIETDKATMPFEAEADGTLLILVDEGEAVRIGEPIARIGAPDQLAGASPDGPVDPPAADAPESDREPVTELPPAAGNGSVGSGSRPKASPLARRLAAGLGVDLTTVDGTGFSGRIVKADVQAAADAAGSAPDRTIEVPRSDEPVSVGEGVRSVELSRHQQVIARRMVESRTTVPDFTVTMKVDMTAAISLRDAAKKGARPDDVVPSFNDLVIKACASALRDHPKANGAYRDDRFELSKRVHVGFAVAGEGTLVVPTVFDADRKGLSGIAAETSDLASRAREGSLTPPELAGGTFTVSNLGMLGVDEFTAVVNMPQAAILAVGSIVPTPVAEGESVVVRPIMSMTLSCDHRILYGADAAAFLGRVRTLLAEPSLMLL